MNKALAQAGNIIVSGFSGFNSLGEMVVVVIRPPVAAFLGDLLGLEQKVKVAIMNPITQLLKRQ
jgi:TctA family transporter